MNDELNKKNKENDEEQIFISSLRNNGRHLAQISKRVFDIKRISIITSSRCSFTSGKGIELIESMDEFSLEK